MRTRRRTFRTAALFGLAGVAAVAFSVLALRPRVTPAPIAAPAAQEGQFSLDPDTLVGWERGPAQPIFFSHRRHAGVFEIECLYCHSNADRSAWAMMPSVGLCLGCHRVIRAASPEIARLRGYQERGEPIAWERIYRVPDFVQFNHSRHVLAEIECQECHGEVEEHDVLWQWAPLTMGWCLECHKKPQEDEEKLAAAERMLARFQEDGREAHSLYPKSINSAYGGRYQGPIDCVACHY